MSSMADGGRTRLPRFSPQLTIMIVFFIQAFAGGGLFPRIPDIQANLGLSAGQLGLTLMGQPAGALTSAIFASWVLERVGPKAILSLAIPVIGLATLIISMAPNAPAAFGAMFLYGTSFAFANVSMNVEADRVEAATGTRVMNRCHGIWSLGFLVASSLGAGARGIPLTPLTHFILVLPVVVVATAIFIWPMHTSAPRIHTGSVRKKVFVVPTFATLLLVGVILSGVMTDTSIRAWSIIFMRDSFNAPDWVDALTLPAFLATLTTGRMVADQLVERVGAVRLTASLLLVAFLGLGLVLSAGNPYQAIGGFALMGFGVCVVFPLTMSAAARIGDRPASENVTSISLVTTFIMMGTPALIGMIADQVGIRSAFGILVPVFVLALILSRRLAPGQDANSK